VFFVSFLLPPGYEVGVEGVDVGVVLDLRGFVDVLRSVVEDVLRSLRVRLLHIYVFRGVTCLEDVWFCKHFCVRFATSLINQRLLTVFTCGTLLIPTLTTMRIEGVEFTLTIDARGELRDYEANIVKELVKNTCSTLLNNIVKHDFKFRIVIDETFKQVVNYLTKTYPYLKLGVEERSIKLTLTNATIDIKLDTATLDIPISLIKLEELIKEVVLDRELLKTFINLVLNTYKSLT